MRVSALSTNYFQNVNFNSVKHSKPSALNKTEVNVAQKNSLDLLKNYNVINVNFKGAKYVPSEDFTEINAENRDLVAPLYKKYQEGMNQKVDEDKLDNYLSTVLNNGDKIFVLNKGEKPAGFIHVSTSYSTIDMCPFTTIQSLFVSKENRGEGLSKKLVKEVEKWTIANDYKGIHVKTHANNASSTGLYKKLGFNDESKKYGVYFLPNKNVLDYKKGYVNTKNNEVKPDKTYEDKTYEEKLKDKNFNRFLAYKIHKPEPIQIYEFINENDFPTLIENLPY